MHRLSECTKLASARRLGIWSGLTKPEQIQSGGCACQKLNATLIISSSHSIPWLSTPSSFSFSLFLKRQRATCGNKTNWLKILVLQYQQLHVYLGSIRTHEPTAFFRQYQARVYLEGNKSYYGVWFGLSWRQVRQTNKTVEVLKYCKNNHKTGLI